MTQTTEHGWTVSGRGYKSAIDMGAPSCAVVTGPNHAANARLIAAAPDLMKAAVYALADLEGIMPDFEPSGLRKHPAWMTIKDLHAAIAKATGA